MRCIPYPFGLAGDMGPVMDREAFEGTHKHLQRLNSAQKCLLPNVEWSSDAMNMISPAAVEVRSIPSSFAFVGDNTMWTPSHLFKPSCVRNVLLFLSVIVLSRGACAGLAEDVIGHWKRVSHTSVFQGQQLDSQAALLQARPCVANIYYEVNADKSFRLNTSTSGCEEQYKKTQERLHAKEKWKLDGNTLMISSSNFAVGQSYTVTLKGNQMTWVGTDGQGTLVYQRK